MLQVCVDASNDSKYFSLAGYIAQVHKWADFSTKWKEILDLNEPPYEPMRSLKMSQMDLNYPPNIERCNMFYSAIESHVDAAISVIIDIKDLFNAYDSFQFPPTRKKKHLRQFYYWGFVGLLDLIVKAIGENQEILKPPIDIFLDSQQEESRCLKAWEEGRKYHSQSLIYQYISTPSFRNDECFMPLQAADMWAFWIRKWESEGNGILKNQKLKFPWKPTTDMKHYFLVLKEPEITINLRKIFSA